MNYTKANNTYLATPKDDPKDRIEVEVGDSKESDFKPQIKIMRWDNECNCSIRLKTDETALSSNSGEKITWDTPKLKADFYALDEGYEFEITLKEKPVTNVIEFTLEDKDIEYFYQPALSQQEIDDGANRPDNIIGSYAVYAKSNKTNYTDGKEYKCGKIGHIYRPKIIDSDGTEVWGELNIDNGILQVTIPQDFLNKAVYPVRHAAGLTFGYTTAGGSTYTINDAVVAYRFTGAVGTGVSMTASLTVSAGTSTERKHKLTVWKQSDLSLLTDGVTDENSATINPRDWETINFSSTPTFTAVDYYLGIHGGASMGNIGYDSGTGTTNYCSFTSQDYTSGLPSNINAGSFNLGIFAIYATYTAAGSTSSSVSPSLSPSSSASSSLSPSSSASPSLSPSSSESPSLSPSSSGSASLSPSSSGSISASISASSSGSSSLSPSSSASVSESASPSSSPSSGETYRNKDNVYHAKSNRPTAKDDVYKGKQNRPTSKDDVYSSKI